VSGDPINKFDLHGRCEICFLFAYIDFFAKLVKQHGQRGARARLQQHFREQRAYTTEYAGCTPVSDGNCLGHVVYYPTLAKPATNTPISGFTAAFFGVAALAATALGQPEVAYVLAALSTEQGIEDQLKKGNACGAVATGVYGAGTLALGGFLGAHGRDGAALFVGGASAAGQPAGACDG
jgi:hypothetical protein